MDSQKEFINFALNHFGYQTPRELIERLYLQTLINCYENIKFTCDLENDIRDQFVKQLHLTSHVLGKLVQNKIVYINWERWVFTDADELGRADLSFSISGIDFLIECKRLKYADINYIREGIARFINLKYAKGDEYSAMIGFVISGNISEIIRKLKVKINQSELAHTKELIEQRVSNWKYSFQTKHQRIDKSEIHLFHLFFNISST